MRGIATAGMGAAASTFSEHVGLTAKLEEMADDIARLEELPREVVREKLKAIMRGELDPKSLREPDGPDTIPALAEWQPITKWDTDRFNAEARTAAPPVRLGRAARRACARGGHHPKTHDGALVCADCGETLTGTPDNELEIHA